MRLTRRYFIILLCLSGTLTGCGQSGKLYLPNNPNKTYTYNESPTDINIDEQPTTNTDTDSDIDTTIDSRRI